MSSSEISCEDRHHRDYIFERRLHRIIGAASVFAVVVPPMSRPLRQLRARLPEPLHLFPFWLPQSARSAALMGAFSGEFDDVKRSFRVYFLWFTFVRLGPMSET